MNKNQKSKAKGKKSQKEKKPMSKKLTRFAIVFVVLLLVVVLPLAIILSREPEGSPLDDDDKGYFSESGDGDVQANSNPSGNKQTSDPVRKEGFYNFLVLGCDKGGGNTDAIMVVSFDTKNSTISTVQIPRDSYVRDENGVESRVNAVYYRYYSKERTALNKIKSSASGKTDEQLLKLYNDSGLKCSFEQLKSYIAGKTTLDKLCTDSGVKGLQQVLKSTFGIFTDYYAVISLNSFVEIVDAVGGVDVYVQENMYYNDPYQGLYINIPAGNQHLDGDEAEGFVRFRAGYAGADIARTNAQKIFMTAFMKKITSPSIVTKIDDIVNVAYKNIKTNVSLLDALAFVTPALKVDLSNINMMTMQGQGKTVNGAAYYALNKDSNLLIVNSFFNPYTSDILGEKLDVIELVDFGGEASTGNMTMADIEDHQPSLGFIHPQTPSKPAKEDTTTEETPEKELPSEEDPEVTDDPEPQKPEEEPAGEPDEQDNPDEESPEEESPEEESPEEKDREDEKPAEDIPDEKASESDSPEEENGETEEAPVELPVEKGEVLPEEIGDDVQWE